MHRLRRFATSMPLSRLSCAVLTTLALTLGVIPTTPEASQAAIDEETLLAQQPSRPSNHSSAQRSYDAGQEALRTARFMTALHQFDQASRQAATAGETALAQRSLVQKGLVQYYQGEYARAALTLRTVKAEVLTRAERDEWKAYQAMVLVAQGNPNLAFQPLNRARYSLQDHRQQSRVLVRWSELELLQGNYQGAIASLQQVNQLNGDPIDKADAFQGLGDLYHQLGQPDNALEAYESARDRYRTLSHNLGLARSQMGLGRMLQQQGELDQAIELYEQALVTLQRSQDWSAEVAVLTALGEIRREQGNIVEAIDLHRQAEKLTANVANAPESVRVLNQLGLDYQAQGDWNEAIRLHRKALAQAQNINSSVNEAESLCYWGEALLQQGRSAEAVERLQLAVERWEAVQPGLHDESKIALFETQQIIYERLQQALVANGQGIEALVVAEQGRARAFVELLALRQLGADQPLPRAPRQSPSLEQIKAIARQENATLVEYSLLETPMVGDRPDSYRPQLLTWVIQPSGEIYLEQQLLPRQGLKTVLSDLIAQGRSELGRGQQRIAFKPPVASANTVAMAKPVANRQRPALQKLHQHLVAPVEHLLPQGGDGNVVFVPQGSLFLVPFSALQDGEGGYQIEHHGIATTPSIQLLSLTERSEVSAKSQDFAQASALVVGNPTMPQLAPEPGAPAQQLAPLPGAEWEAEIVAKALGTQPLIGSEATEVEVRQQLKTALTIHLATHGLYDDYQGLQSALAFAPSGHEDGLLTAAEVSRLSLQAQLVVLSACDTGRGEITGDGVVGLSRSFMAAGVPSLVASLWPVSDESTVFLMERFYEQLEVKGDRAQALRGAMLLTRERYPDPLDWAAFTLIGQAD